MASSQKTILLLIFFNFLLVFLPLLAIGADSQNTFTQIWDKYEAASNEQEQRVEDQLGTEPRWYQKIWASVGDFGEGVYNTAALSVGWLWAFVRGLVPFTGALGLTLTGAPIAEQIILYTIEFFRMTLIGLISFEAFLILRNRKTGA